MKHLSTIIGVLLCVCTLFHTSAAYGYSSQSTYSTEYTPTSYNQYTPYQYSYVPYPTSTPSYKEYEYLPLCALVCEDCLQCYRQVSYRSSFYDIIHLFISLLRPFSMNSFILGDWISYTVRTMENIVLQQRHQIIHVECIPCLKPIQLYLPCSIHNLH